MELRGPPGSWSEDVDRILAKFPDSHGGRISSKVIAMGKAKVIHKGPYGSFDRRIAQLITDFAKKVN